MKSRWIVVVVLLLTVINLAALASFAYHRFFAPRCAPACPAESRGTGQVLKEQLGLDEDRFARLQALRLQHQLRTVPITAQLAEKRLELTRIVMPAEPDSQQVQRICRQIDSLQSAMQRLVVRHLMEQKLVLSPEQQEKFYALMMNCCAKNKENSTNCSMSPMKQP
jgi:Spy/CpxP family protein refolding chaperone